MRPPGVPRSPLKPGSVAWKSNEIMGVRRISATLRLAGGNGVPKMGWQVDVSPQTLGFLLPTGGQRWRLSTVVSGDGRSVGTTSGLCLCTSLEVQWLQIPPHKSLHPSPATPHHRWGGSDPALGGHRHPLSGFSHPFPTAPGADDAGDHYQEATATTTTSSPTHPKDGRYRGITWGWGASPGDALHRHTVETEVARAEASCFGSA